MELNNFIEKNYGENKELCEALKRFVNVNTNINSESFLKNIINKMYKAKADLTIDELIELVNIGTERKLFSLVYIYNNLNEFKAKLAAKPVAKAVSNINVEQRTEEKMSEKSWIKNGLREISYDDLCKKLGKDDLTVEDCKKFALENGYVKADGSPDGSFIYF